MAPVCLQRTVAWGRANGRFWPKKAFHLSSTTGCIRLTADIGLPIMAQTPKALLRVQAALSYSLKTTAEPVG